MRVSIAAWAGACALAAGLFCDLPRPAAALTAVEARDAALDEANAANALAVNIRAALNPERCLTAEDALGAIQNATAGARIQTIASALDMVSGDRWWCESVRLALTAAEQAANPALVTSNGRPPGAHPRPLQQAVAFGPNHGAGAVALGAVGSPGGGGGSGYVP
jgi:hypothetical protein